ncbi:sensor domain-containing diguanylate cyclase [Pseudomonas chlororaphis]|uniref:sensor domain-containing diguanylate cyclase n=1 Tax=Pseudomonas chlororaphis TaxID=587753 RepID=UPI0015DDF3F4|nr:sensor domain-containing diguanylate cyclase [Pseudomonas chlororaphis]QLL10628.1 GGDEF domain-containing protein [Pseudomonas chlororaphis subsp. aurantiaca]
MDANPDSSTEDVALESKRLPVLTVTIAFLMVVAVSILSIYGIQVINSKAHELAQARLISGNLALSMAQQATDTFDEANLILEELIERIDDLSPQALEKTQKLMKKRVFTTEQLHGLFFYDREGNWVLTSFDYKPPKANNSDRDYFKFHRENVTLSPRVGAAVRSKTTGDWVIPFSRRVNDTQGNFKGVVLATIKMDYFDTFFDRFNIDDKGAIFLALPQGTIIARRPFDEKLIGASLARGEIFSVHIPRAPADTVMVKSIIDGVDRLFGYRVLYKYPLVVAAANSQESILSSWRADTYKLTAMIAVVLAINLLIGILLFKQVRKGLLVEKHLKKARSVLETLVLQDGLTGLANRRHLERNLELEWRRAARQRSSISLIMLDIDHFKSFNDRYGHVAGDHCICAVSRAISQHVCRPSDLAVRYGGEEFAILLPDTEPGGAYVLAESIRLAVQELAIEHVDNPGGVVTISLGLYTCVPASSDFKSLLMQADSALYMAKRAGRNQTVPTS